MVRMTGGNIKNEKGQITGVIWLVECPTLNKWVPIPAFDRDINFWLTD